MHITKWSLVALRIRFSDSGGHLIINMFSRVCSCCLTGYFHGPLGDNTCAFKGVGIRFRELCFTTLFCVLPCISATVLLPKLKKAYSFISNDISLMFTIVIASTKASQLL